MRDACVHGMLSKLLLARRFLVRRECHSFLLLGRDGRWAFRGEHPDSGEAFGGQRDHAGARDAPDVDAHAAERCAGEAQYPFDVEWQPARGHPEHG
jgi:hypothetical protein